MLGLPVLPVVLLLVVLVLDVLRARVPLGLEGDAMTDEPAHAATALLVLLAVVAPGRLAQATTFTSAALLASIAIDLDHLPLYAGVPGYAEAGRPFSHSLATVAVLLVLSSVFRGASSRWAARWAGAAAGVGLHLVRDAVTGPGVPLLWPLTPHHVLIPYACYLWLLVVLTAWVLLRGRMRADRYGG